jgi:hypothetical protein
VARRESARLGGERSGPRRREQSQPRQVPRAPQEWRSELSSERRRVLGERRAVCSTREWAVRRARPEPRSGRRWPSSPWRPSRLFRRQRVPRDVVRPRRRAVECGPPGRLRSTPRDSRRRCLVFGRVQATLCSLARVLWRARALVFSLEPKRSLTSMSPHVRRAQFPILSQLRRFPGRKTAQHRYIRFSDAGT